MRLLLILLLAICLTYTGMTKASAQTVPEKVPLAFTNVNVIPMDSERILTGQTVLVEDGIIVAMGPDLPVPAAAQVIDGNGAWLLPGLADMHNHLHSRQDLVIQLGLGITTTLHMGEAPNRFVGRMREAVANGQLPGPRTFVALAVDGSPRYGHLVVTDADDARATVRVAKSNGYDFLKLYNNLSPEVFDALMSAAGNAGIPVVGHGVTSVGLHQQIEAGQALVAHAEEFFYTMFPSPPEDDPTAAPDVSEIAPVVAHLLRHGTPVVADLVTYQTIAAQWGRPEIVSGYLRSPEARYLSPQFHVSWPAQGYIKRSGSLNRRVTFLSKFVYAMQEAGVPLLSGTDSQDIPGLFPGFSLHRNLEALEQAGLSRYEALVTATRAPGEFIFRHRPDLPPFGVVVEGARADLILVRANPLEDLSTLARPLGVMADGRWYPENDLAARMEAVGEEFSIVKMPPPVSLSQSEEFVKFEIEDGQELEGTLHLPPGEGPFPAAVVLHGASDGQRDHPLYHHLARTLNRAGIAVFVYDRRDEHLPRAKRVHPGYMAHGRDAIAAVRSIGSRSDIDEARIGLWGVSQGGWTAPAAYVQSSEDIAFLILVSSSGVGPAGQMEHAVRHVLEAEGFENDIVEKGVKIRAASHAYYRGEIPLEKAQSLIDMHKGAPWFEHLYLGTRLPESVEGTGWANEVAFEPFPIFSQVRVPTILFYGESDPWIPVEESILIWRDAATKSGNNQIEAHRIHRAGHMMIIDEPANVDASTVGLNDFSGDYVRLMEKFIQKYVLP